MTHTGVPKKVTFSPNDLEVTKIASGKRVAIGLAYHHAEAYEFSHFVVDAKSTTLLTHGNEVSRLWHEIFSHLNFKYLHQLQNNSMVEGLPFIKATIEICKGCIVGKHPKHKFDWGKASRASCILGLIHSDISGPMPITSMNWSRYILNFIDDFLRYTWVFFYQKEVRSLGKNHWIEGFDLECI